jgi:hypothetical protein
MEEYFQRRLIASAGSIPIISVMKRPRSEYSRTFAAENLLTEFKSNGWSSILHQMRLGLTMIGHSTTDSVVYLAEHDVLYHSSYFEHVPEAQNVLLKNRQLYFLNRVGFMGPYNHYIHSQTIGWASLLDYCLQEDVPGDLKFKSKNGYVLRLYDSEVPSIDVRHSFNYTGYREPKDPCQYKYSLPHWGEAAELRAQIPGFGRNWT